MATISLTVPDPDVARIIGAFLTEFGPKRILDPGPPEIVETDAVYFKRVVGESINRVIKNSEVRQARDAALAAHVDVPVT